MVSHRISGSFLENKKERSNADRMSVEACILLLRFIYSKKQSKEKEKRKEKWEKLK